MIKIKEMEDVMVTYYKEHLDEAGVGLEILPGVKNLLEALKVGAANPAGAQHHSASGVHHFMCH